MEPEAKHDDEKTKGEHDHLNQGRDRKSGDLASGFPAREQFLKCTEDDHGHDT